MNPPDSATLRRLRLIGIADPSVAPWEQLEPAAVRAVEAGLPALMLRDHESSDSAIERIAGQLRAVTRACGALLLINRRIELALRIGADGVHVGKGGATIAAARRRGCPRGLVGYSAHSSPEAKQAFDAGADYVFYSPIFDTPSKQGILAPVGLNELKAIVGEMPGPVVALGGIDASNISEVLATGACGVAIIRGIFSPPLSAARQTHELLERVKR